MPPIHFALLVLICLAWGGNFLASAYSLLTLPPFLFTALRLAVVLLVLLPFLRPLPRDQWGRVAAVGTLNGALHFGFNFWALKAAGDISSNAILLQSYIPISALLAWWFLGERFGWRTGAGIAVAFAGVLVLGFDPLVLDAPMAALLALLAAFTLALGTTLMRGLRGVGTFELQAWGALLGMPLMFGISALFEHDQLNAMAQADWLTWGGVLYGALIASVVGHGLLYFLVQRHPISQVTPYLLLAPMFAVALGVLVWGDSPGPRLYLGGAMVLLGILIIFIRSAVRGRPIQSSD